LNREFIYSSNAYRVRTGWHEKVLEILVDLLEMFQVGNNRSGELFGVF
jgi:hypothetical protein